LILMCSPKLKHLKMPQRLLTTQSSPKSYNNHLTI
jgi:hypothetical protein